MEILKCSICELDKPLSEFYKANTTRRGYSYTCKKCHTSSYKRDKENAKLWARKYRLSNINKNYEQSYRKEYLCSLSGVGSKLLASAKRRALKKGLEFCLDKEWINEKLKNMTCSVTKLPLSLNKYKEQIYRVNPYSPSLDRIDPTKGYTKENTRIVCWIYNVAKSDFSDEDLLILSKAILNNSKT